MNLRNGGQGSSLNFTINRWVGIILTILFVALACGTLVMVGPKMRERLGATQTPTHIPTANAEELATSAVFYKTFLPSLPTFTPTPLK
jgi:hypothetical protein